MTKEEILSKLQTIRNNKALPEKQKGMLIDKYEKMLVEMGGSPKPKAEKKPRKPRTPRTDLISGKPIDKKTDEALDDYFDQSQADAEDAEGKVLVPYDKFAKIYKELKNKSDMLLWVGWDTYGYDEIEQMGGGDFKKGLQKFMKDQGISVDYQLENDPNTYRIYFPKETSKKTTSSKATKSESEYDCDELIDEAKERKAKALAAYEKRKNAPKKSAATKSKDAVIRAEKSVEKGVKKGDISVSEIEKIISEYEEAIKKLKVLLEQAKNKMAHGGSVDPEEVEHILMKAQGIKEHHCKCQDKMATGGNIYADLSEKEFLTKYWGANTFIGNPSEYFDIKSLSSSNDAKIEAFISELKKDGYSIKKKSYSDFTSVMGVKKKTKMARGGGVGQYTAINLLVKKPHGNEQMEIAKFKGKGDALIAISALNQNSPSNYEYSVSSSKKYAEGGGVEDGVVGQEIIFDFQGDEKKGVIIEITDNGDFIVLTNDGRRLLAEKDLDVISLGKMHKDAANEKKRFGFFKEGGRLKDDDLKVGSKFTLRNGDEIVIKAFFTENIDENWVRYTRNGKESESSLKELRMFINRVNGFSYGNGGGIDQENESIQYPFVRILPHKSQIKKTLSFLKKYNIKMNYDGKHKWPSKGYGEEVFADESFVPIYIFDLNNFENKAEIKKGLIELDVETDYSKKTPSWVFDL